MNDMKELFIPIQRHTKRPTPLRGTENRGSRAYRIV